MHSLVKIPIKIYSLCFFCIFSLGIFFASASLLADKLYLNNGEVLQGKFLRIEGDTYHFQLKDGSTRVFSEEEVDDVEIISETQSGKKPKQKQKKAEESEGKEKLESGPSDRSDSSESKKETISESEDKFFISLGLGAGLTYLGLVDDIEHHLSGRATIQLGFMIKSSAAIILGADHSLKPKSKVETETEVFMSSSGYEKEETEFSYSHTAFMLGGSYHFPSRYTIGLFGRWGGGGSYETLTTLRISGMDTKIEGKRDIKKSLGFGVHLGREWQRAKNFFYALSFNYNRDRVEIDLENQEPETINVNYYGLSFILKYK